MADKYTLIDKIGIGSTSKIWKGRNNQTGQNVAIKIVSEPSCFKEILALEKLHHSNIINFYEAFQVEDKLWIIMEFVEYGSLHDIIKKHFPDGIKDPQMIASIAYQVIKGLEYLHSKNIIHRDIKSANVLINKNGDVKLTDFGISKLLESREHKTSSMVGTPCWMAPEVLELKNEEGYNIKADIWSLGITLIEIFRGSPPFACKTAIKTMLTILKNPKLDLSDIGEVSKKLKDLIEICIQVEPEKRWPAAQLLEHDFFKTVRKRRFKFLKYVNPTQYVQEKLQTEVGDKLENITIPPVNYEMDSSSCTSLSIEEEENVKEQSESKTSYSFLETE